jgi:hypothetical protein
VAARAGRPQEVGFGDYPGYTHGDGCPCPMCKGLETTASIEVVESHLIDDDTVLVVDKAALTSVTLVEPKWEPPPDYRTAAMQERIYLGLDFGRSEPEDVKLFDEPGAEPDWSACEVGEAHFSDDRVYRYALTRTWDDRRPLGLIIGLNPSTADEYALDNTLRRCIRFANREGWGGFWMANLFALRATKPAVMKKHPAPVGEPLHPVTPELPPTTVNDAWLLDLAGRCSPRIICAWGTDGDHLDRDRAVLRLLKGFELRCFGTTAGAIRSTRSTCRRTRN